jgi:hemolysin activation/secretion protein
MLKARLFTAAFLALSQGATAQQPPTGGQLQQIPPPPAQVRPAPDIRIEQGTLPSVPATDQTRIVVNSLRISGASLFPEADLIAETGFRPGTELTLAELRGMAARITDHYRRNGYFVAQTYLPPQDIKGGVVTLNVLEGRYGKVMLRNEANLSSSLPSGLLEGLNAGDPIAIAPLETRLLLLSDIPGVEVKSTLVPGASVGTSDLIVDVTPGRAISGSIEADNHGNRYTGEYRVGGTVYFNNLTGHGDVLSFRGLTSGQGLKYGRAAYQTQLGRGTVGVAYTAVNYRLGKEFAPLGAHGTVRIASVFGSYPLIRSRNSNLYVIAGYDAKTFQDIVDTTSTVTDKKAGVFMAGLHGNHRDGMAGGGVSTYAVTWHTGNIDIRTPAALAADAATARTNGHFDKVSFSAARMQNVTDRVSLYGAINGQFASKNLDVSEKIGLGGAYGVRSYPQGEGYGDEGFIVNLEARLLVAKLVEQMAGQVHLIGFFDTGTVKINENPWAPGDNRRTLSGAGIGITWEAYNNFALKAYYAHKVGNAVALSAPDRNARIWLQAIKYF